MVSPRDDRVAAGARDAGRRGCAAELEHLAGEDQRLPAEAVDGEHGGGAEAVAGGDRRDGVAAHDRVRGGDGCGGRGGGLGGGGLGGELRGARGRREPRTSGTAGRFGVAAAVSTGPVRFMLTVIAPASTIGIVDITPWRMRRRFSPAATSFAARATSDGRQPGEDGSSRRVCRRLHACRPWRPPLSPPPGFVLRGSRSTVSQKAITVNQRGRSDVSLHVRNNDVGRNARARTWEP